MKRLDEDGVVDELVGRLARLTHDTRGRWGKMTSPEMVCHLHDSYRVATGERDVSRVDTFFMRTVVRFIALHTALPWPHGVPTRPEVDPHRKGTRPADFERQRETLASQIRSFAVHAGSFAPHPGFGPLTRREWMMWGYRHADHHFRQFGI
jgi:Protein of unknown function (DUF1569)